jgi:hypothetical protein
MTQNLCSVDTDPVKSRVRERVTGGFKSIVRITKDLNTNILFLTDVMSYADVGERESTKITSSISA